MAAEALTAESLEPLLRERLSPEARCRSVVRGPVGNAQETWFVEVELGAARRALVVRRSAAGSLAWTDRTLEFGVLRAIRPHGIPVPEVLWMEAEPSSLGPAYLVMERMPGAPPGRAEPGAGAAVADQLGTLLARLHRLDLDRLDLDVELPGSGSASALAELARWRERYLAERIEPVPMLGALIAWMETAPPAGGDPPALLWGDPGPHNVLVQGDRVSALLDWELSHAGHPLDDLGAAVWAARGPLVRERLVRAYEAESGVVVEPGALRWFECLACVSRSVMVIEGARAFVEGRSSQPSQAGLGLELLADNLERAARLAGWPEPSAATAPAASPPGAVLRPGSEEIARGLRRFLDAQALPAVEDRAVRRGLKQAAALMETLALRAELEPAVREARERAERTLLAELARAGVAAADLEQAAVEVERREELAHLRTRVRGHLVDDLARARSLIAPLHELYSR